MNYKNTYDLMNDEYKDLLWGLRTVNLDSTWKNLKFDNLSEVKVAIIDSGIESTHEDLVGNILPGYNFLDNSTDTTDNFGHGTRIAGIIGATRNNNLGVAGVASGVKIIPLKVYEKGSIDIKNIINALQWCIDKKIDVINISMGYEQDYSNHENLKYYIEEKRLIQSLINKSTLVVAPVGNKSSIKMNSPASYNGVISVGSCRIQRKPLKLLKSEFNNFCDNDTIYAPGEHIYTTDINNKYVYDTGTSCACAFVSGALALLKSEFGNIDADLYIKALLGFKDELSYNINNFINIDKSIEKLKNIIQKEEKSI